jgi:hypothetical protein
MNRPLIQIDDLVREMTEEEHENYLRAVANTPKIQNDDETPSPS